ncbi:hypothetical protein [Streptomyces atacamensis]|uniref:hypothetical protein n=1 Tax=Streptomyces atacamensis TaxID=531966 RepID=UPI00399CEBF8
MQTTAPATAAIPAQAEPTTVLAPVDREHGSRIIEALEGAWAAIREAHPEVPRVVMITGSGRSQNGIKWGHFGADFWTVRYERGRKKLPELFAGGELLSLGGRRTMQTLIHEAAHAVAHARQIKDTSSAGRYHNKRFAKIAEELGLTAPTTPAPVIGWSDCHITDATAAKYAAAIEALDAARLPYVHDPLAIVLGGGKATGLAGGDEDDQDDQDDENQGSQGEDDEEQKPKKRPPTRFLVICGCTKPGKDGTPEPARRIQISRAAWEFGREEGDDDGALMCGRCKEPFRKADPDNAG